MDRKGKQKVKFIGLFLGVIALIVIVFVYKVISENRIFEEQIKEFNQTLVMITHDETIAQMADVVVVVEDGKVVRNS